MQNIFPSFVPIDLTNLILEFTGYHQLRNGKYMKQLSKRRLRKMNTKIRWMPQKNNGYVALKLSKTLTEIIIGPSFYYSGKGTRL
jgi:hypothetical protein